MRAASRITPLDLLACVPFLCFAALMGFVALAWLQVGHWPVYAHPDPKSVGFALPSGVRIGAILQFLLPLILTPLSVVATVAVCWAAVDEVLLSKRSARRKIAMRSLGQIAVCVVGCGLFLHLLGSLSIWLLD